MSISIKQLDRTFAAMSTLKPLAAVGKGNVAAILPDTVSSARYTQFDAPYLTQALTAAGLSSSQFSVQNAQGSDATELSDAQAAITKGASVLIMDPLDSGVGAQIESYAKAHGAKVIDYDRLTLGGSRAYYVSFNNVLVGTKIGQGFTACAAAWHVTKPNVLVMKGDPTDNNATLFAQGYLGVLNPFFSSGKYVNVGEPAGTWTPTVAESEFQQAFTAHKNINSVLTPNDENAAPIITYLQRVGVKPKTFPVTGQDATTIGLQNILSGYQCGTVYKPIYIEAQAAVALAMFLRAGQTPPSRPGERLGHRHQDQHRSAVGAGHAGVGHHEQHGIDRHRGQVRDGHADMRRPVRGRLQGRRDLVMSPGWLNVRRRAR